MMIWQDGDEELLEQIQGWAESACSLSISNAQVRQARWIGAKDAPNVQKRREEVLRWIERREAYWGLMQRLKAAQNEWRGAEAAPQQAMHGTETYECDRCTTEHRDPRCGQLCVRFEVPYVVVPNPNVR